MRCRRGTEIPKLLLMAFLHFLATLKVDPTSLSSQRMCCKAQSVTFSLSPNSANGRGCLGPFLRQAGCAWWIILGERERVTLRNEPLTWSKCELAAWLRESATPPIADLTVQPSKRREVPKLTHAPQDIASVIQSPRGCALCRRWAAFLRHAAQRQPLLFKK